MSVRLVPAVFVPCMLLATFVHPAHASRAELAARALPRLLAVDPTNVLVLPASLGGLPRQAEIDYTGSSYERFAMGMAGSGTRFAYILDGRSHNLALGGEAWGLVLGIQDSYTSSEIQTFNDDSTQITRSESEQSRRTVRLGLGWQSTWGNNRVLQLGVGGSWIDAVSSRKLYIETNGSVSTSEISFTSDPGWGVDATLQFLGLRSGLQLGVRYEYTDLSLNTVQDPPRSFDFRERMQSATLDLGGRFHVDPLDDLVAGCSLAFAESWTPASQSLPLDALIQSKTVSYFGAIFLSGEKRVWKELTILGGVRGPIHFTRGNTLAQYYLDEEPYLLDQRENDSGSIDGPEIRLGVTWAWRSLVVTGQLREEITLTDPFLRWAATLTY